MRTTVTLDDDATAVVEQFRRDHGIGMSAAVNELIRRGIAHAPTGQQFVQRTSAGHARMDVTNIAETLDLLDEPTANQ